MLGTIIPFKIYLRLIKDTRKRVRVNKITYGCPLFSEDKELYGAK